MKVYFDPLDVACKSITGATSDRQSINIKIEINKAKQCYFSITSDDGAQALIKMQKQRVVHVRKSLKNMMTLKKFKKIFIR